MAIKDNSLWNRIRNEEGHLSSDTVWRAVKWGKQCVQIRISPAAAKHTQFQIRTFINLIRFKIFQMRLCRLYCVNWKIKDEMNNSTYCQLQVCFYNNIGQSLGQIFIPKILGHFQTVINIQTLSACFCLTIWIWTEIIPVTWHLILNFSKVLFHTIFAAQIDLNVKLKSMSWNLNMSLQSLICWAIYSICGLKQKFFLWMCNDNNSWL